MRKMKISCLILSSILLMSTTGYSLNHLLRSLPQQKRAKSNRKEISKLSRIVIMILK